MSEMLEVDIDVNLQLNMVEMYVETHLGDEAQAKYERCLQHKPYVPENVINALHYAVLEECAIVFDHKIESNMINDFVKTYLSPESQEQYNESTPNALFNAILNEVCIEALTDKIERLEKENVGE